MTSKRELEATIQAYRNEEQRRIDDRLRADKAQLEAKRYRGALVRVAKHFGFYDQYTAEEKVWVQSSLVGGHYEIQIGFSVDDLIADLDAIDQARSADEARARLGIKEEA